MSREKFGITDSTITVCFSCPAALKHLQGYSPGRRQFPRCFSTRMHSGWWPGLWSFFWRRKTLWQSNGRNEADFSSFFRPIPLVNSTINSPVPLGSLSLELPLRTSQWAVHLSLKHQEVLHKNHSAGLPLS